MRIRMYHSGDGDCLLLTATKVDDDGNEVEQHVLADGGRKGAFRDNARDDVYSMGVLELIYLSHIDEDHIAGVLGLVEDMVEWRVHNRRLEKGEKPKKPGFPEPPHVKEIWHNSLFELVGDDLEPKIEGALANAAGILAGSVDLEDRDLATRINNLATGEKSSMELSRRISDRQLGIKRNRPKDELMVVGKANSRKVGAFTMRILGPTDAAVEELRGVWDAWIKDNNKALRDLQKELLADERNFGTLAAGRVARPNLATALGQGSITEPNLASLMLLASGPDAETILLTGDGSSEDILAGLDDHSKRDAQGRCHVNALKVQHHGATANVTEDFVDHVTADNYLFCGNGNHHNPEKEVVERFARARLGPNAVGPASDFKFWFSSRHDSNGMTTDDGKPNDRSKHMKMIEETIADIAADEDPDGRFSFEFLKQGHLDIVI